MCQIILRNQSAFCEINVSFSLNIHCICINKSKKHSYTCHTCVLSSSERKFSIQSLTQRILDTSLVEPVINPFKPSVQ